MKKILSVFLSFVLVFLMAAPSFASVNDESSAECDCGNYPVIIVRGMDFGGLYVDRGTENEKPAINTDASVIASGVFKAVFSGLFNMSFDALIDEVCNLVFDIFGSFQMDENGDPMHNVTAYQYPESAENYEFLVTGGYNETGMARACIEELGEGHTYYVNYDWRLDPFVVADDINAAVESATEGTGHDKVNIICCSMGGQMTLAYLTEFGYEDVNKCLFMSSTFCGAQVASDLLTGKVDITADNLYNFVSNLSENEFLGFLIDALYNIGVFNSLTKLTDFILDNYKEDIFRKAIIPIFANMPALWGLVQAEDYDDAINYIFGGRNEENARFLERTDKLQAMMNGRNALLEEMIESGIGIAIVAHYDAPVAPVYENADFNGDSVLETYQMSGYATVAPYGKTLGDDYVAENPEYLSPDRVVDLSTAIFPEYTYIIKGAPHVSGAYDTDYSDFVMWLLTHEGEFYAGVNEKYPQFMLSDSDQSLKPFI